MNVLVAADKFKGSLTAWEACSAVKEGVLADNAEANVVLLPLADGGEDTLDILEPSLVFKRVSINVTGPLFEKVEAWYGLREEVAYIEMAKASGLLLLKEEERHALSTTTLGTGELILDALKRGVKKIYLFVGGSATNDAGIGLAHALGYRFFDEHKNELKSIGASLLKIHAIDDSKVIEYNKVEFVIVTDVQNPLYGENGAAKVFAKQKGASEEEIEMLDAGLKNFNKVAIQKFNRDVSAISGAGAAGGIGAGAMLFLNAKVKEGINTVMDVLQFDSKLEKADFVISGEGRFDTQTLNGKVIQGVMNRCVTQGKPLGVVCGSLELSSAQLKELPIVSVEAIKNDNTSLDEAIANAYQLLTIRSRTLFSKMVNQ